MQAQERYNLGGVMLPQPFKIRRLGHFGLNVDDTQACLDFYCNTLGFRLSDPEDLALRHPDGAKLKEIGDTRLYFTRHGTDHHSFVFGDRRVFNAMGRGARLPDPGAARHRRHPHARVDDHPAGADPRRDHRRRQRRL